MRNSNLPVNIFNNNQRKNKINSRLCFNKQGGPLIHIKVDSKFKEDLFLLEDEKSNVIMSVDCNGNINKTDNENNNKTIFKEKEVEMNFENGVVMGCWRMIPENDNLLIQKYINGVWVTKQLLT